MSCDVGEVTERLENELEKRKKGWRMSCDVGEELILQPFHHFTYITTNSPTLPSLYLPITLPTSQIILQPFCHFTYVTTHSPTLPSFYLRHSSFSSPSFASLTSQLFLQSSFRSSYVTGSSLTSSGEPPMFQRNEHIEYVRNVLTLIVPSAKSVSPLKIAVANRLIHAIHKNGIVYLLCNSL